MLIFRKVSCEEGIRLAGIFITGNDTDVGKTVACAYVVHALRQAGINAVAYKPVQTGIETDQADMEFYKQVAGHAAAAQTTYTYKVPCSPHLAAELENSAIGIEQIIIQIRQLEKEYDLVVVEGAGGLVVPLSSDGTTMTTLIQQIGFPVLVVAKSKVGVLNHTALTIYYARSKGIKVNGIILNECGNKLDPIEEDNKRMLEEMNDTSIIVKLPVFEPTALIEELQQMADSVLNERLLQACEVHKNGKRYAYSKK